MTQPNEVKITVTSEDATDAGFRSAEKRGETFGGRMKSLLKKSGIDGAEGFGLGFSQRIGPLIAKAPIGGPLISAVAAVGPVLGGTLSAGIALGAGVGAVALGAALSTRNPVVAASLTDLKTFIGSELEESAKPFVPAMLRSIDRAKLGFRSIRPELDAVFAKSATYLDPLADGITEFVANALPGLEKLVDSAEPLVDIFGEELPKLGSDFGDLLESLGSAAAENEDEFRAMLTTIGLIVEQTSFWVERMEYLGAGPVSAILDGLEAAKDKLSEINEVGGSILGDAPDALKSFLYDAEDLAEPFDAGSDAVRSFREEMDKLINNQLDLEQATLNWREAVDGISKSIDENGKSLNSNTEKGRANRQNLLDLAEAGLEYADAVYKDAAALGDVEAAEAAAEEAYQRSRAQLVRSAEQFGLTTKQAEAYVTEILGIPPTRNTTADFTGDDRGVSNWKKTLSGIPRSIFTSARLRAIVDVEVRREQATEATGRAMGGIIGTAQSGGLRSGLTMTGEYGRELVKAAPGSHVYSNPDTERMLAGQGGAPIRIEVGIAPGGDTGLMAEVVKNLLFTIRTDAATAAEIRGT